MRGEEFNLLDHWLSDNTSALHSRDFSFALGKGIQSNIFHFVNGKNNWCTLSRYLTKAKMGLLVWCVCRSGVAVITLATQSNLFVHCGPKGNKLALPFMGGTKDVLLICSLKTVKGFVGRV